MSDIPEFRNEREYKVALVVMGRLAGIEAETEFFRFDQCAVKVGELRLYILGCLDMSFCFDLEMSSSLREFLYQSGCDAAAHLKGLIDADG